MGFLVCETVCDFSTGEGAVGVGCVITTVAPVTAPSTHQGEYYEYPHKPSTTIAEAISITHIVSCVQIHYGNDASTFHSHFLSPLFLLL